VTDDLYGQNNPTYLSREHEGSLSTMVKERSAISRGLAVLPLLLMSVTHFTITPLKDIFEVEPIFMYVWYGISLLLGFVLFRKTRTVRDYEFHRAKAMKSMKKVYEAEEAGVWQTNVALDSDIGPEGQMLLQQSVSSIDNELPELELSEDEKVEVDLLLESESIRKANRRVTGAEVMDDELVTSTIGAKRKSSPMDSFLDFLNGIFGKGDSNQRREVRRQAALRAAASASPVTAQRPVAPIRSGGTESDVELRVTSVSDGGGIDSYVSESGKLVSEQQFGQSERNSVYAWDQEDKAQNSESLESMAMLGSSQVSNPQQSTQVHPVSQRLCKGCGATVPLGEPFCLNCGLDV
jgi:hypothetical protein